MSSADSEDSCSSTDSREQDEHEYDYVRYDSSDTESVASTHDEPVAFERMPFAALTPPSKLPPSLLSLASDFAGRCLLLTLLYPLMLFSTAKRELPLLREHTSETSTELSVQNRVLRVLYFLGESPKMTLAVLFNYKFPGTLRHRTTFGW